MYSKNLKQSSSLQLLRRAELASKIDRAFQESGSKRSYTTAVTPSSPSQPGARQIYQEASTIRLALLAKASLDHMLLLRLASRLAS